MHYARWRRTGAGNPVRTKVRPTCTVDGCDKPNFGHGMCAMHYARVRNHGSVTAKRRFDGDPLAAFEARIDKSGDCWLWTGAISTSGYAMLRVGGRTLQAHRWYYELTRGPVAGGRELDHVCHSRNLDCAGGVTCRHRRCVNPDHLEPVAQRENWRRGRSLSAANLAKTHCKRGHEFSEENTYRSSRGGKSSRSCRACGRRTARDYVARRSARDGQTAPRADA